MQNPGDHRLFPEISKKLKAIFPKESEETWYIEPKTEGKHQTHPKGKIPIKVRNEQSKQRNLRVAGLSGRPTSSSARPQKSSLQTIIAKPVTEEIKGAKVWLQRGRTPWPTVLEKWRLTAPLRFRTLFIHSGEAYINSYLNEWAILEHNSGHELLLEDFNLLWNGRETRLFDKWESFERKTLTIAKKDIKDKLTKVLLKKYKKELNQ
ncbi:uncharacterized protein LOC113217047, partial [Frankliniella occidentalis]|uniref:Uncharacterized protein LOC113217047 n=1 Tax=Frankliniella occidentalis TaxID=133901 RepID=A0A9C6XD61_FRAOC